jgi:glucosamine-6-phosphate deaminase
MAKKRIYNGVNITVAKNYEELSQLAADILIKKIKSGKKINLLIPTGQTPVRLYEILSGQPKGIFKKSIFFNFDEYCNDKRQLIPKSNPVSFRKFMDKHLFGKIGPVKSYFPGTKNIPKPGSYDKQIEKFGGIDLCINALGVDGHTFGFNFPGSDFDSVTRLVEINQLTRKINQLKSGYKTPRYAITTGIKTGMASKQVLFLVSGKSKAPILKKIIKAKIPDRKIPATILKLHQNCIWVIDKEAASELN